MADQTLTPLTEDGIRCDDSRLADRVLLKYTTDHDYAWESLVRSLVTHHRYYRLLREIREERDKLTMETFREYEALESSKVDIDEDVQDIAKSMASLASVDGALVLTTQFAVLGFGGEIVAASPTLKAVTVASDRGRTVRIETFGTRHRSAFRFCSSFENSAAFVISSDGGVKAAKRHGRELLFWPDINQGALGL